MKKLLPLILILGFMFPIQPANAIFGLSKCEKVKKEMMALEKPLIGLREKILGNIYKQNLHGKREELWVPLEKDKVIARKVMRSDPLPKIWKLATNNAKCFTVTQNMQIKQGDYKTKNFIEFIFVGKYDQTGECLKWLATPPLITWDRKKYAAFVKKDSECFLASVESIQFSDYQSIYSY